MLYVSEETAKSVVTMADAIETIEGVFCEIGRGAAKVFPVVMGHGPKQGTSFSMKSGLLTNRGVLGLNASMFKGYLRYIANRRAPQIGLEELFPGEENPFPWMSEMIDLKKERNFFETRVIEYQTGGALSWD
mgnify:CR=1 FL=1